MNDKKISFITCVNDQTLYNEALYYIGQLNVPQGYEVECIAIENAESMTQGYNRAMSRSDAKYKVYLHQDVLIINQNFISDIFSIFQQKDKVGLIGMTGVKKLPTSGLWFEGKKKCGKVYANVNENTELISYNEIAQHYEYVEVVSSFLIVTQHDVLWREDLFDSWDFYNISQSLEFKRIGYKVVVPNQKIPWTIHDNKNENRVYSDFYRKKILKEYSKDIFPLVSILIPTYNRPDYFKLALESVLDQTYYHIEIIIGDDSTDSETEKLVKSDYFSKFQNITYYHNKTNLGQFDNDLKLFDMAKGDYINYLMDDDLFAPTKIEKMMNYFIEDYEEEISLVTSYRKTMDENGEIQEVFGSVDKIIPNDALLDGIELGNFILTTNNNCIGEPTTVLFRKSKLEEPFGTFNGRKYGCNVDQASWLNLLSNEKVVFIAETLSYFRIHSFQQLGSLQMGILGAIDYAHEVLTAHLKGFLQKPNDRTKALSNCILYCNNIITNFKRLEDKTLQSEYKLLVDYYNKLQNEMANYKNSVANDINKGLPLVSILIPAYNQTKFLKEALESAINQTYPNIEIIIGDDSTNDDVEKFVKYYLGKYNNITYFKNKKAQSDYGYSNFVNCLKQSNGEYVNYLNHDDLFHPEKIERMMNYFIQNPNLVLVTSSRQLIDQNGVELSPYGGFAKLFKEDTVVKGEDLSQIVVKNVTNFIGEPTTVLFKRKYIKNSQFGYFNGVRFKNIGDVATWFTLLQYGDAVYISDTLSYFRVHSNQNSNNPEIFIEGIIAWYKLIRHSADKKIIQGKSVYNNVLNKWLVTFVPHLDRISKIHLNMNTELIAELAECYKNAIGEVLELN